MAKDLIKQLLLARNYSGNPNDLMSLNAIDVTDPQISEMASQATAPIEQQDLMSVGSPIKQQDLMSVGSPIQSDVPNDYVGPQEKTIPIQQAQNPITSASGQKPKTDYDLLKDYKNIKDSELSALQRSLTDYTQSNTGPDLRPIAAWASGLTGNKQLYEAASAMAPKSNEEMAKTLLDKKIELAKMASDHKYAADMVRIKNEEAKNQAQISRAQTAALNYDLRLNKNASDVGREYENNKILNLSKTSINSLKRAESILINTNKPVTAKDLNLAYNDFINAVDTAGKATEGKIAREMPVTLATSLNELKQKIGSNQDLRLDPAGQELIKYLQENIRTVKNDINEAISEQATNIHSNYLDNTNERAIATNRRKLKEYAPEKYYEMYGGESPKKNEESRSANSGYGLSPEKQKRLEELKAKLGK